MHLFKNSTQNFKKPLEQCQLLRQDTLQPKNSDSLQRIKEKQKRIKLKPSSLIRKLVVQYPINFNHVHNVYNIIGLNQWAIKDNQFEESFFKSMFYIKTVEKVDVRKHAIVLHMKNIQKHIIPIQYVIQRFKSFGENHFYQLACQIEGIKAKNNWLQDAASKGIKNDCQPLSRYIDFMQDQMYMSKVAPNKLVISKKLLEFLGYDSELFSIQICKYRTPLREIISTQLYSQICSKSLENISQVISFMQQKITLEELQERTSLTFTDYVYTKHNKKIFCNFNLHMPNPLISTFQITQILSEAVEVKNPSINYKKKKKMIEEECQNMRYRQAQILKGIIHIPKGLLAANKQKLAGYTNKQTSPEIC